MKYKIGDLFVNNHSKLSGIVVKLNYPIKNHITIEWSKNDPNRISNEFNYNTIDVGANITWKSWTHYPVIK
jgi:hypothetical protein